MLLRCRCSCWRCTIINGVVAVCIEIHGASLVLSLSCSPYAYAATRDLSRLQCAIIENGTHSWLFLGSCLSPFSANSTASLCKQADENMTTAGLATATKQASTHQQQQQTTTTTKTITITTTTRTRTRTRTRTTTTTTTTTTTALLFHALGKQDLAPQQVSTIYGGPCFSGAGGWP